MINERYYLNNITDSVITIQLSTKRVILAKSSLPLNDKDVAMFKLLRAKRAGKMTVLNGLRLSKIPIENDSNYSKNDETIAKTSESQAKKELEAQANAALTENANAADFVKSQTEEVPEGTTEPSNETAADLEAQAMTELEAGIVETEQEPAEELSTEETKSEDSTQEEASTESVETSEESKGVRLTFRRNKNKR